ncbi:MAG: hypothetical protein QM739_01205 [Propionivibrio sp.]
MRISRSDTYTFTNVISGTGKLNQVGGGTTVLTADNTYFGGTSISNGIVQVGDGGSTGSLGSGGVTNHGTLIFNRSNNITIDNLITGSGSVRQLGSEYHHADGEQRLHGCDHHQQQRHDPGG